MASSTNKPSLAILDDYADIAAAHFSQLPDLHIASFPETLNAKKPEDLEALVQRLQPFSIISSMRERTAFPRALQERLPNLKLLLTTGLRNASIDLKAASDHGIIVTGAKGDRPALKEGDDEADLPPPENFSSVNQHAWALLLALCSRLPYDDAALKTSSNAWQSGFMVGLPGKTLALLGLGKLGALMARTGVQAFGMKVVAWSANLTQEKADETAAAAGLEKGTYRVAESKEELFRVADVLSLHLVLSERSRGIVGREALATLKPSAIVVNTSRGPLIDEEAFVEVLREGRIGGAALDVFDEEPLPANSPWRSKDFKSQVVLSPHMGYANSARMNRWYQEQVEIVGKWLKGEDLPNKMN